MRWLAALSLCAGCGDNLVPAAADAAPPAPDAFVACTARMTGNFVETVTTATSCAEFATAEDGNLALQIKLTSANLVEPFAVAFEIARITGDFSSQTVMTWSSVATRSLPHDMCLLAAGDQAIPKGAFTLHLDSATPSHGTFVLDQPVHATAFSDCGAPLLEHFEVTF